MIYMGKDTQTLVALTLAGNQGAYEELVIRYQTAVIASACAVTHNEYMAEDAAQDAFVSAWLKLSSLREAEKFGAWVCRIAKNCAKNIMVRYREYISYDDIANAAYETGECPESLVLQDSEEESLVGQSMNKLPEKVRKIIKLHYFDGYSVSEIAGMLTIPVGTVKYQLHEGRKKMRKELCAMNENMNDTLVQKVMKKVEEFKLWGLRNNKEGVEKLYEQILTEIEGLPDSKEKQGMLADVLMCGCWWIPGKKNEEMLSRIKTAALESHNEDVMQFIVANEDAKYRGKKYIEFVKNVQMPFLSEHGLTKTLGYEWFWVAKTYFDMREYERGFEALEEVLSILEPSDVYYAAALSAKETERFTLGKADKERGVSATGETLRKESGKLYFISQPGYSKGGGNVYTSHYILWNASHCDRILYDDNMRVGDVYNGTDGKTSLAFIEDGARVETPCGIFENCEVWLTSCKEREIYTKTYYKEGVGIVKSEYCDQDGVRTQLLKRYNIAGGSGKLPLAKGNRWEYSSPDMKEGYFDYDTVVDITSFDGKTSVSSSYFWYVQKKIDENDFVSLMYAIRNGYVEEDEEGYCRVCDVAPLLDMAQKAAKTKFQKAYFAAASSVARRIMETDDVFNPKRTASGHWNFFHYAKVIKQNGKVSTKELYGKSFELKDCGRSSMENSLLYNFVYLILENLTGMLWNDEWCDGFYLKEERVLYNKKLDVEISCSDVEKIVTPAGEFEDCRCLTLKATGIEKTGWAYQGGHKEYYFAPGVGIVRMVAHRGNYTIRTVYDLARYIGTGEGYMPLEAGFLRRYEAQGLTDGYVASAEYTFENDDNGRLIMFTDQEGIRMLEV